MQVSSTSFSCTLTSANSLPIGCWRKFPPSFGALFVTKAKDYKLRPNEELSERLVGQLLKPNFEKETQELSIGCRQLPWMIRLTALLGQFHPGSYTRSLFYIVQEALRKSNQSEKANRLFVRLQLNRLLYPQKINRTPYLSQKTMTSKQYQVKATADETNRHKKKAWVLHDYDEALDFLTTLNLPKRQWFQPFLITIGFVPETIQPLASQ